MKLKLMPIFAGLFVIAVVTTPFVVQAGPNYQGQKAGLELTQEQQNQMQQIRRNTRSEIEAILTSEQKQQFQAALEQRRGMRSAIAAMNLSPEQQTQLRNIMQSAKAQKDALLTSEQKQQLQERRSQRQQQNSNQQRLR